MRTISGRFFIITTQFGSEVGEIISLGKTECLIQWWFTKQYFIKLGCPEEVLLTISDGELIRCASKYQDWVSFAAISGKVHLLTEQEYFTKEITKDDEFFNRNSEFEPKTGELKIGGVFRCGGCKKAINPDHTYVVEDDKDKLFHMNCREITI